MGWIKAELDERTHEALRKEVEQSPYPTHEVAARLIKERLETSDTMAEVDYNGLERHGEDDE
jgi:hypothetical protein